MKIDRRRFLQASAAAVATSTAGPAGAQAAAHLALFGLVFTIESRQGMRAVVAEPSALAATGTGIVGEVTSESGNKLEVEFSTTQAPLRVGQHYRLLFSGRLRFHKAVDGAWRPAQSVGSPKLLIVPNAPYQAQINGIFTSTIAWQSGAVKIAVVDDQERFQFDATDQLLNDGLSVRLAPFTLITPSNGGFALDLGQGRANLVLPAGALELGWLTGKMGHESLPRRLANLPVTIDLSAAPTVADKTVAISFEPVAQVPLPLHVCAIGGGDVCAVAARSARVTVTISRKPVPATFVHQVSRFQLAGRQGGELELELFGLRDDAGRAMVVRCAGPLDLAMRPATATSVGSFLLRSLSASATVAAETEPRRFSDGTPWSRYLVTRIASLGVDPSQHAVSAPPNQSVVDELWASDTLPTLNFRKTTTSMPGIDLMRPGESITKDGGTGVVEVFHFRGDMLPVPVLPRPAYGREDKYIGRLDDAIRNGLRAALQPARHDSGRTDGPAPGESSTLALSTVFGVAAASGPQVARHVARHGFGPVVTKVVAEVDVPEYRWISTGQQVTDAAGAAVAWQTLRVWAPDGSPDRIALIAGPAPNGQRPLGLVKLGRQRSLRAILERLTPTEQQAAGALIEKKRLERIHASILDDRNWTGAIFFDLAAESPRIAKAITVPLVFEYLAMTACGGGDACGASGTDGYSVSGRIWYEGKAQSAAPDWQGASEPKEAAYSTTKIDIEIVANALSRCSIEGRAEFRGFFGLLKAQPAKLVIQGNYDRATSCIRFLGRPEKPAVLFEDATGKFPVAKVSVNEVEIRLGATSEIALAGKLDLNPVSLGDTPLFATKGSTKEVVFRDLAFTLPDSGSGWRLLECRYPSVSIPFTSPQFEFGPLHVGFTGFAFSWKSSDYNWQGLPLVGGLDPIDGPTAILRLKLQLAPLPDLGISPGQMLNFDFDFGLPAKPDRKLFDVSRLRLQLVGGHPQRLDIDLLRFLSLTVEEVAAKDIDNGGTTVGKAIALKKTSLKILEKEIFKNLDVGLFQYDDRGAKQSGFMCGYKGVAKLGPLEIGPIFFGQNLPVDAKELQKYLAPALPPKPTGPAPAPGQRLPRDDVPSIIGAFADDLMNSAKVRMPAATPASSWAFAAYVTAYEDFFIGRFGYIDGSAAGMMLTGPWLEQLVGTPIAISAMYIKGAEPSEDRMSAALACGEIFLPGGIMIKGGVIRTDIYVNGGFYVDIGFPHANPNGSRQWERAVGIVVPAFQGSGGVYLRSTRITVPMQVTQPGAPTTKKVHVVGYGLAIQFGLGAAAKGDGAFRVYATAGIYGILEGNVAIDRNHIAAFDIVGAVGILVMGAGELNVWVISARFAITLSAEIRVTIVWGLVSGTRLLPDASPQLLADGAPRKTEVELAFIVYANVQASACIGSGWFKVCASFSFTLPMQYKTNLTLA